MAARYVLSLASSRWFSLNSSLITHNYPSQLGFSNYAGKLWKKFAYDVDIAKMFAP
jgi:hypothetical protein